MYQPVPQVHEDFLLPLQSGNMDTQPKRRKRMSNSIDDYNPRRKHRRTRRPGIPPNVPGNDWREMAEALIHNRVDLVRSLLKNGVAMKDFLTIGRLENLYNSSQGPKNTLPYIVDDVVKVPYDRYELPFIGLVVEKLMANGFRSSYGSQAFLTKYQEYRKNMQETQRKLNVDGNFSLSTVSTSQVPLNTGPMVAPFSGNRALSNHLMWRSTNRHGYVNRPDNGIVPNSTAIDIDVDSEAEQKSTRPDFEYPFSELLIWAVLTRRHEMALCMWEHGEEALAKSLLACRLYKSLANEASEDYLELDICEEFRRHADEFRELSVQLLDNCYKNDEMRTLELLTYEMSNWSRETNLRLAIIMNNKQFIAHPCCQALLADLWHGGMRIRSNTNLKVIMGLLLPPTLLLIDFKSAEELKRQPQTAAEHADDSDSDEDSDSSGSQSQGSDESVDGNRHLSFNHRRRVSTSSSHSNLFGLFRSRRKRQKSTNVSVHEQQTNSEAKVDAFSLQEIDPELKTSRAPSFIASQMYPGKLSKKSTSKRDLDNQPRNQETIAETAFQNKTSVKRKKDKFLKQRLPFAKKWKMPKDEKIRFQRRVYEFFVAPITTFWAWTISFAIFLAIFTFVLLIKTPPKPTVYEWALLAYVLGFFMEMIRKLFMCDPKLLKEKIEHFLLNYWNAFSVFAISMFLIGFAMRVHPDTRNDGRVVLGTNYMLWCIKLLDFLSVHPKFGPYVNMIGKMILSMTSIVVMLAISLLAFGVARQSITYPNEEWNWLLLRNVFYKPYFMLYGEVYADEIDTCGDEAWDQHQEKRIPIDELDVDSHNCVTGYWVPPLLMTVFLLFSNILLISMLIAIFNNIFDQANKVSHQIWLFQRYRQVMEYQNISILPPPFTPIYHLHLLVKLFKFHYQMRQDRLNQDVNAVDQTVDPKKWQKAEQRRKQKVRLLREQLFDSTLKLFFDQAQIKKLHVFEKECVESLMREKEYQSSRTNDERLYRTSERTELILQRLHDISTKDDAFKENVRTLENRMAVIEEKQAETLRTLQQINNAIPQLLSLMVRDCRQSSGSHGGTPPRGKREKSQKRCCEFLKKYCDQYLECDLRKDSAILAKERLNPSCFNHLIELYDRHPDAFKNWFPGFASCNLIALYEGMKRYVRKNEESIGTSNQLARFKFCSPPTKESRLEASTSRLPDHAETSSWIRGVKVAISPTMAVTYKHGGNSQLKERNYEDKRTFSNGDYLELYFLFDEKRKPVRTEVVQASSLSDFILLEAIDGQKFFHGDIEQHNFEVPQEGQEILCVGLTNETVSQQAIAHGVVQNDVPDKRKHIVADFITCPSDSGGGVFSQTNGFLGIVSRSVRPKGEDEKFNYTRTHVVSSMIIKHGWETFLEDSGKVAGYSGIRRGEE